MEHSERRQAVLAADGGGTRCRFVLDGAMGHHRVEVGPANVASDFDGAIAQIEQGLTALAASAGMDRAALLEVPAYLGLAGGVDAAASRRVADALPLRRVRVEDDRRAALRGALEGRDGMVAHCGTGSFVGAQIFGQPRFAGGWGARLGDEASAFWVARRALSDALEAQDGTGPASRLTTSLLDRFAGPGGLVAFATAATTADIAALAPVVTQAAEYEDPVAQAILQDGAAYLVRIAQALGWQPGMVLCLTGGLGPVYQAYLPKALGEAVRPPSASPLEGALDLARALVAEGRL